MKSQGVWLLLVCFLLVGAMIGYGGEPRPVVKKPKPGVKDLVAVVSEAQKDCAKKLGLDVVIENGIGMKLVLIPAGEFMMGCTESPQGMWRTFGPPAADEYPQHKVRITKPFYLGVYEVTQAEYEKVMGRDPSYFKGASNPVERVDWHDAKKFCKKLSAKEGKTYRLPTEAEWEYACRAGSTTLYSFGDTSAGLDYYAWGTWNSDRQSHQVGQKEPNTWGLYDMHGNVWEWCADRYDSQYYANSPKDDPTGPPSGTLRVVRGGGWDCTGHRCLSSTRQGSWPRSPVAVRSVGRRGTSGATNVGFRVAAVPPGGQNKNKSSQEAEPGA